VTKQSSVLRKAHDVFKAKSQTRCPLSVQLMCF